jgi:hypothetical protein
VAVACVAAKVTVAVAGVAAKVTVLEAAVPLFWEVRVVETASLPEENLRKRLANRLKDSRGLPDFTSVSTSAVCKSIKNRFDICLVLH